MSATQPVAGAAPDLASTWHTLSWGKVWRNVRRLQARIVKAVQEGRWGKVQALQHLLTHAHSGRAAAVLRVTSNSGSSTPGTDGDVWDSPEKKAQAVQALRSHGYHPQPLRRLYIPKSNGRKRPLGIPTLHDRAMQALYALALDPVAETCADANSYGFRRERCCADALEQCHKVLGGEHSARWVLEGDIRSCFDRISHAWLEAHVPMSRATLHKWLCCGYLENGVRHETTEGTPQGGVISPILMNLTLDGLEGLLHERFGATARQRRENKVHLVRYADDFVITGTSPQLLMSEVKPVVQCFLRERGLELSEEKTQVTPSEDGFDFLGQTIRRRGCDRVILTPSRSSVQRLLAKVGEAIERSGSWTAGKLIAQLNPLIRGWTRYHRHASSSRTFAKVERAIFRRVWRWARKRHRGKRATWVKRKYFVQRGDRGWVFRGELPDRDGKPAPIFLVQASRVRIRRQIKVRGEANPYDPRWEPYFEERLQAKMTDPETGHWQARLLWKVQDGVCAVCNQKITLESGWHVHHNEWRVYGGSDLLDNLVLLHRHCHRQVHAGGKELDETASREGRL
jgi:RNA-directed DNA polymerase